MADPLSISSLVLQIGSLLKQLIDYGKAVSHAQKDILSLHRELSALKNALEQIEAGDDSKVDKDTADRLQHARDLVSDLCDQLSFKSKSHQRVLQSLKWPLKDDQIKRALAEIERLKTWFLLSMMSDTQANLTDIDRNLNNLTTIVQANLSKQDKDSRNRDVTAVRNLLAPVSPSIIHRKASEICKGTPSGSWLLDGEFQSWLFSSEPNERILALTGRSGSGKTVVLSQAIEHARKLCIQDPKTRLGYHYCSYSSSASQELRNILGSWLVQISNDESTLVDLYKPYLAEFTVITSEQIEESIAASKGILLLFLDAVNESPEMNKIRDCVVRLSASTRTTIKCFVTTTPTMHRSVQHIRVDMQADRITPDIEIYISHKIAQSEILQSIPRGDILEALVSKANGMFRWVDCQIVILAAQRTPKLLMKALKNLPGTLNETYAMILKSIPMVDYELVREALLWLCYVLRPLKLEELSEGVIYEVDDCTVDDTCRLRPLRQLIQLCNGLVVLDEVTSIVTLAHSSVREFLTQEATYRDAYSAFAIEPIDSQTRILRKCLSYLSMDDFRQWWEHELPSTSWFDKFPLLAYISENWCLHAVECQYDLSDADLEMVDTFICTHRTSGARSQFTFWIHCLLILDDVGRGGEYLQGSGYEKVLEVAEPLYYISSFGFDVYVKKLLTHELVSSGDLTGPWHIDHKCGRALSSALQVASWRGNTRTARLLMNKGADTNSTNVAGVSCLGAAWKQKRIEVASDLLVYGARLNRKDEIDLGIGFDELQYDLLGRTVLHEIKFPADRLRRIPPSYEM